MKVFVDALKINSNESFVGVTLIGDHNQQYFSWTGLLQSDLTKASLMGIRRAFSFKQNMKPLYCQEKPLVFNNFVNKDMLENDEYCKQFNVQEVSKFNTVENERDLKFIEEVRSLTQVHFRQYYLIPKNYNQQNQF